MVEPLVINQGDENIIRSNTLAGVMSDLYSYRVPLGSNILLSPDNVIAIHLLTPAGATVEPTAQIRVELRSPLGGGEAEPILGATLYQTFAPGGVGEFRHTERLVTLQIPAPRQVIEQAFIVIQAQSTGIISAALSWFELRTHEIKV